MYVDLDGSYPIEDIEKDLQEMTRNPRYQGRKISFGLIQWPETSEKLEAIRVLCNKYGRIIEYGDDNK